MTELQLKSRIGVFLIISHCSLILLVVVLYLLGGFLFEEMTTTIVLIVPMCSIFTTAIVKDLHNDRMLQKVELKAIPGKDIIIAYVMPAFLTFSLSIIIFLKAFNIGFTSFDQFKILLGAGETAFGVYGGFMLFFLLKKVNTQTLELNKNILYIELVDMQLQERCLPEDKTDSKLWDSAVRTAGVILEERLREVGEITDNHLVGNQLVNAVFKQNDGTLAKKFSVDAERQGHRDLYAGIVGALRNPYAHKLIDPTPEDASASLIFVDLLLRKLEDLHTSPDITGSP